MSFWSAWYAWRARRWTSRPRYEARAAADPRYSLPPPPLPHPPSSLLTLRFRHPPRSFPPVISSSRPWQAMLRCRQDGQGHLRTLWLLRATTGTRPPCCASCEQWKSVSLRRRCVSRGTSRAEEGGGESRAGPHKRLLRSGSTTSRPLRPAGRGRGCESAADLEGAAVPPPISCRRGERVVWCGAGLRRPGTVRAFSRKGWRVQQWLVISIAALLSRSLGAPCGCTAVRRHA